MNGMIKNEYAGMSNESLYAEIIKSLDKIIEIVDNLLVEDFRNSTSDEKKALAQGISKETVWI